MNEILAQQETVEIVISEKDARELTEAIKATTNALYSLLKKAHDTQAWVALGYKTFKEYVESEFNMSRQRAYQLLTQADTIEAISEASGTDVYISERDARQIKKSLPKITEQVRKLSDELNEDELPGAVQEVIENEIQGEVYVSEEHEDLESHANTDPQENDEHYENSHEDHEDSVATSTDEAEFYATTLMKTLRIFGALPDASQMAKSIASSSMSESEAMSALKKAKRWINDLIDKMNE